MLGGHYTGLIEGVAGLIHKARWTGAVVLILFIDLTVYERHNLLSLRKAIDKSTNAILVFEEKDMQRIGDIVNL